MATIKARYAYLEQAKVAKVGEREFSDELGPHEVLVHALGNNLCTTDYQQWLGLREHQGYPMAGGHEGESVILAMGSEVKGFELGDKVAFGYEYCGRCDNCRKGMTFACENQEGGNPPDADGVRGTYGMSTVRIVNDLAMYKMNPDLSAAEAGFLEPIGTVCSGIKALRVAPHETIVVIGAGTMGLANALVARAFGARVIVSELMENKLEMAKKAGFEVVDSGKEDVVARVKELTDGKGADAVILAVSNKPVIDQSVQLIKDIGGRVLFFAAGYPAPETTLEANVIHYRRIEFIGTMGGNAVDFDTAAMLLNTHAIDVSYMCEPETFDMDHIQEAFEAASTPGKYRVHVTIPEA